MKSYLNIVKAILENGQYNTSWPYIHHTPEQVIQAARDLKTKRILPDKWLNMRVQNITRNY